MDDYEYDIVEAIAEIEEELIESMLRNMRRHKVEEVVEKKRWAMWQVLQLQSLERYKNRNMHIFGARFDTINELIEDVIRKANAEGMMDQETEILAAINDGFIDYERATEAMEGRFFRINEEKLEALVEEAQKGAERAETAILRLANDEYRKAIFNAATYAATGAGTYEKAVDMALKDFLSRGLACVEYSNGSRHTLREYAQMAIRTATTRAYLQGEGVKRQQWGVALVITNKRTAACPKCAPFAGKIFVDDVWSGGHPDGEHPLISEAIAAGLYHPNCRDHHTTFFPGISKEPRGYTRQSVKEMQEQARKEAKERYYDQQAEKYERLAEAALDPENKEKYKKLAEQYREKEVD